MADTANPMIAALAPLIRRVRTTDTWVKTPAGPRYHPGEALTVERQVYIAFPKTLREWGSGFYPSEYPAWKSEPVETAAEFTEWDWQKAVARALSARFEFGENGSAR